MRSRLRAIEKGLADAGPEQPPGCTCLRLQFFELYRGERVGDLPFSPCPVHGRDVPDLGAPPPVTFIVIANDRERGKQT